MRLCCATLCGQRLRDSHGAAVADDGGSEAVRALRDFGQTPGRASISERTKSAKHPFTLGNARDLRDLARDRLKNVGDHCDRGN